MTKCYVKNNCKYYKLKQCKLDEGNYCPKLFKLNALYDQALLPLNQRYKESLFIDYDGTDREAFQKLKSIENNIELFVENGNSLFLYSHICGNGKTAWSLRMIQSYFNAIWHKSDLECKALFINTLRFLLSLKDNISHKNDYAQHILKYAPTADLVVWDEIGTKEVTQFEHEHLLNLINMRIDTNKAQIFTSNLYPDELREFLGDRLYSRIINLSTLIELKGKDKRGIKG